MAAEPEISFLTPVYEAEATLSAALAHILAQETERSFEVVVVDDGSRDRSLEIAREVAATDPRVTVLSKENGGEASALNVAWAASRGHYVAIVEGDVEPAPDWLETCLAVLEAEADVWAVGGYLETPAEDSWIARLAGYEIERKFASKPREAKHLTSANVLYRGEAFALAGPFDERLVNASLDSVFNGKLAKAGKRLVYEAKARVRHHYKATAWSYIRRQYAYARFRVHNEVLDLYPADRFLAAHVFLAALATLLIALAPLGLLLTGTPRLAAFTTGPALLLLAFLLQLPQAFGLLISRGDAAALLYPPVILLRNIVGAFGYGIGLIMKTLGRV